MGIALRNKRGSWKKTTKYLGRDWSLEHILRLKEYGEEGVRALEIATPKDTGLTSRSWNYFIEVDKNETKIVWSNSNINDGYSVALLIQYGHGTKNGGYVKGRNYINPAIQPIFDKMVSEINKEIRS